MSAATAILLLRQATTYISFYSDDKHHRNALCGNESHWDWSLDSDCFRVGFLWPVLLLLASGLSFAALTVSCLLPASAKSAGFCGVGNWDKPVRRPHGPTIMRDNRAKVGRAVMAISVAQATLLIYAWSHRAKTAYFAHAYLALVTLFAVLIAIANATCLAIYVYSDRMLMSVILLLSYARVQLRPVFTRPLVSGSVANLQPLEHTPVSDVKANHNDDDEVTPLARRADQKPVPLIESHEFNVSWYSTLAFSWNNDILRRGTARQLEATDLYHLSDIDMPTPNWRRYVRHRKPGRSLLVTVLIVFAPELILQAVLSLINSILLFLGPLFLQRILRSIEVLGGSNGGSHGLPAEKSFRSAYLDAFGLLIFTLAASILYNQTMWIGHHIEFRLKGLLVAELSSKTLRRRGKGSWEDDKFKDDADKDEDEDEDDSAPTALTAADGKIMNLLTADILKAAEDSAHQYKVYPLPLMPFACIWYVSLLFEMCMPVSLSMPILYIQLSKVLSRYLAKVEDTLTEVSYKRIAKITAPLH
ncbi:hypothetical protein FBU31_003929, partial [Coemansia sp. 'formosensis']